ncbi:MAG: hypothetical protein RLZZ196_1778 [Bacteroidota bacterium]|jgi:hypothetical protein
MLEFWSSISKMNFSMSVILAITVAYLLLLLYVWHKDKDNKIDLRDLICKNGKIDEKKFTRLGAWIVSTWGFVYLILDSKFTEWYFTGYITVWVGNAIVDKYLTNKQPAQQG